MTADEMNLKAINISDFSGLQQSADDTFSTHVFTCGVNGSGQHVLTDRYSDGVDHLSRDYTLDFTSNGALATLQSEFNGSKFTTPITRTGTFTYPGPAITLPASISAKEWELMQVHSTFAVLKVQALAAARAKVKKTSGQAARVTAVRKIAKTKAGQYFFTTKTASVSRGIRVSTAKFNKSKSSWYFTMTVTGAKVALKTNLQ